MRKLWKPLGLIGVAGLLAVLGCLGILGPCWRAWLLDGVLVGTCPAGEVRPIASVTVRDLGRGEKGTVEVHAEGLYVLGTEIVPQRAPIRRFSVDLEVTDPTGKKTRLDVADDRWVGDHRLSSDVTLPEGPDGDWTLHVAVDTPAGDVPVDVTLPVYAPALAHVLTDAPLYKPGQTMRFRAVLLHEADLTPLAGRPGVWTVTDPEGNVLLEEKGTTSPFGVAASSFPLLSDAATGRYEVRFTSGATEHHQSVEVKTFQLPRFLVEAKPEQAWWQAGGSPVVSGHVRYTSGAPVGGATVVVNVRSDGEWPPPAEWLGDRTVTTDAAGGFRVAFGVVPADLRGQARLLLSLSATDTTGDTNSGAATVLLTEDRIVVDAVTELADGLVPAASNRVYLRVTSPDGQPLRGASLTVTRDGDRRDPGVPATTDADGVARFQIDPLQPVTVVVPPLPVRALPRERVHRVTAGGGEDVVTRAALDVEGATTVERWGPAAQGCLLLGAAGRATNVSVVSRMDAGGRVTHTHAWADDGNRALADCVARAVRGVSGRPGTDRLWRGTVYVPDADAASLVAALESLDGGAPGLDGLVQERARAARACVAGERRSERLPAVWYVSAEPGSTRITLTRTSDPSAYGTLSWAEGCVAAAFEGLSLESPTATGFAGVIRLAVEVPPSAQVAEPQPTTFQGYALRVAARVGEAPVGETLLRMRPGAIPPLRLRLSEVLVDPGATVELTAVRGPDFVGEIPDKLTLFQGDEEVLRFPVKDRKGSFTLPKDARGYYRVTTLGAQATLFVRDPRRLDVALTADGGPWRPGAERTLTVSTRGAEGPVAAGVTLSGVDSAFAALAPLPGPDTFADVTVRATSDQPAFGVLDARALQTGQIRGENAAQAAVLRVSGLPPRSTGSGRAAGSASSSFDPHGLLEDAFYALYAEARAGVRRWEKEAPAEETLSARRMAEIWETALAQHPTEDAFGRRMHLSVLPADLLALTDPRFMVSDGARLPEDVENWSAYVASEAE